METIKLKLTMKQVMVMEMEMVKVLGVEANFNNKLYYFTIMTDVK